MRLPFRRRRRWDEQPTTAIGVLLASDGTRAFEPRAVAGAIALARERGLASASVITIAKVHGTGFGLPHPGLMPTKAELVERTSWVNDAARDLKRAGIEADGQVASTRHPARVIVNAARIRSASVIVVDRTPVAGWRRFVEGDLMRSIKSQARSAGIEIVDAATCR